MKKIFAGPQCSKFKSAQPSDITRAWKQKHFWKWNENTKVVPKNSTTKQKLAEFTAKHPKNNIRKIKTETNYNISEKHHGTGKSVRTGHPKYWK